MTTPDNEKFAVGFGLSLAGHVALFVIMVYGIGIEWSFQDPVVYSVTLEGGANIGGINQFEESKRKVPLAQPEPQQKPQTQPAPKEEPKKEAQKEPEKPDEKAEVSIAEKKEPEKKEEKKEPKKEEPRKEPKKEEKPKKEEAKPPPKKTAKEQVDDEYKKLMAKQMQSTNAGGKGVGAAKLGGNSWGGGEIKPPEFFAYMRLLEQHIKSGWHWYDPAANLRARMTFNISAQGTLSNVQVETSSGVREFDESVLRAIAKSNPVPIPPPNVFADFKFVRMTFDPSE